MTERRPAAFDPAAREAAVVELLDRWPWEHGGTIVGGYAVAAYGRPRYSVDLDVVLPRSGLAPTVGWLRSRNPPFTQANVGPEWEQNYGGTVSRFVQGDVTVDLLPVSVRDRDALVDVPYEWIAARPRNVRLVLLDASTRTEVPLVRPEALWLLKLQSGRPHDVSDLFAIHEVPVALEEVRREFERLWRATLEEKLRSVAARVASRKQYEDSLSRWSRGAPGLPANKKAWARFRAMVAAAMPVRDSP